ncbi:MAG: DUF3445 domain-containing protein [Ilumatobacteraceae bacterium]|nr:DUF3445 domain-containing protein [Ilumatobacteraceae bacterium]
MTRRPPYEPWRETTGEFRWRLGVRPLDLERWIEIGDDAAHEIALKAEIMSSHPSTAFCALGNTEDEAQEVLEVLVAHLEEVHPSHAATVKVDSDLHPLDAAGRLIQEDLVLMVERDERLVFGAGSVCFPNRWDLRSKLGLSMSEVHEPVALLNEQLGPVIDDVLRRLTPDRPMWRLGWGVIDTEDLYQAVDGTAAPRPVDAPASGHHLRIERETLRRFPQTNCVLFTIRTHNLPLPDLVDVDQMSAVALADAIESMPIPIAEYKQLDRSGNHIADWLRSSA